MQIGHGDEMSILKSIRRHAIGIVCEMLTLKDPYDKRVEVKVLGTRTESRKSIYDGHPMPGTREVITVQANNYRDLERFTDGITPEGNRSFVHTRVGHNKWEISTEEWDTSTPNDNIGG